MNLHELLVEPLQFDFMQRALLTAVLLGVSGGLMGGLMILRRLSLMGDALSHSLLPGIGIAYLLFGSSTPALVFGALLAGLLTALGSALLSRLTRIKEDAAFGSLFVIFFGVGVTLVSLAKTRVNLTHFLFGNVLGVSVTDLWITAAVCLTTMLSLALGYRPILLESFDPVFYRATGGRGGLVHMGILTLVVLNLVAALQTMGIVLSLGLFLLPAVSAYLWCDCLKRMMLLSTTIAVTCSIIGILASYHLGLPSGSCIVITLGVVFFSSATCSPRYGLLSKVL